MIPKPKPTQNVDLVSNNTPCMFLHIHKFNDKQCYWLGVDENKEQFKLFTDVRYASPIPKLLTQNVVISLSITEKNITDITCVECDSETLLTPSMRKTLRLA